MISPLTQILGSREYKKWSSTWEAFGCETYIFSLLAPQEMYKEQFGEYAYWR